MQAEWQYLLSGGTSLQQLPNPSPTWLSERAWLDIMALSALPNFTGLADTFSIHEPGYKRIFDSSQPHRYPLTLTHTHPEDHGKKCSRFVYMAKSWPSYIFVVLSCLFKVLCMYYKRITSYIFYMGLYRESLPTEWETKLDSFQRLLLLRCLRVDHLTHGLQDFVSAQLGQRFIEPQVNTTLLSNNHLSFSNSRTLFGILFTFSVQPLFI